MATIKCDINRNSVNFQHLNSGGESISLLDNRSNNNDIANNNPNATNTKLQNGYNKKHTVTFAQFPSSSSSSSVSSPSSIISSSSPPKNSSSSLSSSNSSITTNTNHPPSIMKTKMTLVPEPTNSSSTSASSSSRSVWQRLLTVFSPAAPPSTPAHGSTTAQSSSPQHTLSQHAPSSTAASTLEMHSRLEAYANRLAEVEQRQHSTTPDSSFDDHLTISQNSHDLFIHASDSEQSELTKTQEQEDEHQLIAQYCHSLNGDPQQSHTLKSPMQILLSMDTDQRTELEAMIHDLEEENKNLQVEYDRLKQAHRDHRSPGADRRGGSVSQEEAEDPPRDAEMIAEAKLLRQHKGRLEARMQILEDHNRQLEAQLHRLRQLLEQPDDPPGLERRQIRYSSSTATTPGAMSAASSSSSLPRGQQPSYMRSHSAGPPLNGHDQAPPPPPHEKRNSHGNKRAEEQELEEVMREIQQSFPPEGTKGNNNVGTLFNMAGQVGKAVGSLVTVMTDDEGSGDEEIPPRPTRRH